jgi:hypothetical protein
LLCSDAALSAPTQNNHFASNAFHRFVSTHLNATPQHKTAIHHGDEQTNFFRNRCGVVEKNESSCRFGAPKFFPVLVRRLMKREKKNTKKKKV